jgi:hypothetical protein
VWKNLWISVLSLIVGGPRVLFSKYYLNFEATKFPADSMQNKMHLSDGNAVNNVCRSMKVK